MNKYLNQLTTLLQGIPLAVRYGVLLGFILVLVKSIEYHFFSWHFSFEMYSGLLAIFFLLIGIFAALLWRRLFNLKQATEEEKELEPLTVKEQKLLIGLVNGLSNQQLADTAFLSVNTIKTHLKNIYRKLEVSSRTEAVSKAKKLHLLE
jgi:two-component system, NarL family, response regulator LiaR